MSSWAMRDSGEDDSYVPPYTTARTDDFSCDPSKWSWNKLARERKNGFLAVIAEYERRIQETDGAYSRQTG